MDSELVNFVHEQVADNLKRALGAIPEEKLQDDSDKYLKELYVGVDMTVRKEGCIGPYMLVEYSVNLDRIDPCAFCEVKISDLCVCVCACWRV